METPLVIINAVLGAGGAFLLARGLGRIRAGERSFQRRYGIFLSIYFVECAAMLLGMGVPLFSLFLSFIWAAIFGMYLSKWDSRAAALKASFILSLYTSLPAMTFVIVPIAALSGGRDIMSVEVGSRFGIPQFSIVPAPFRTILGFYISMAVVVFALKTSITMGGVVLVTRGRRDTA